MLEMGQVIPSPLCAGWTETAQPNKRILEREKCLPFHETQCSSEQGLDCAKGKALAAKLEKTS